jgi:hypothetical protein
MPRHNIDYSKSMMYKIVSNDLNITDCYVGSTTEFTKRKYNHKSNCANINSTMYNFKVYKFIRDNGDWQNWSMILIEMFPCTNHLESLQRERYWCEHLNATLNSVVPSRSDKEYRLDHTEQIKQYNVDHKDQKKEYCINNKEHIKEYKKQYYVDNKEQIKQYNVDNKDHIKNHNNTVLICQCGCSYTRCNKLRHERSNKHQEYIQNRLYYDIQRGLDIIKKLDAFFKNK